jgi:oxygen-independent coproporphyrinogen III oxidase
MNAGIYIHIPFCKSRCSYCDFATDVYRNNESVERYVNALCQEIENYALTNVQASANLVETLYFGGGTPSLLAAKQLEKILNTLQKHFIFTEKIEFTLEMNPATVTLEKLQDFKSLGVNRASFGVQTFDDRALKILARGHDANDVYNTFRLLRQALFDNISFDLIGGLPNQTLENWEDNLNHALELETEHLSLYLLEICDGTPLAEQIRSQRQPLPDEELSAKMYEVMVEKVTDFGYEQYEISAFSKPQFQSKHNSKYWLCEPVVAFGVSAHSFDGKSRWANERDTNKYVSLIENGENPIVYDEEIDLASEFIFLNLRLTKGLNLLEYEQKFKVNLQAKFAKDLDNLLEANLVEINKNNLRLTKKGMVYSNEVFAVFV